MKDKLNRPLACKFKPYNIVRHVKSETEYEIILTPTHHSLLIEKTCEFAYAYKSLDNATPYIWVRCQSEMEDGRFELIK